jgi:threonine dehydrogenase-like Zn-dependent dehydrogenase
MLQVPEQRALTVMDAAVLTGAGEVKIVSRPLPEPGPGEVRIRLEGCGVCASNLVPWAGPDWMNFPTEPGALGHEGWGHIDALGPGMKDIRVGQRVAVLSYHAYATHDIAAREHLVILPPDVAGRPFPGEPLGCAMNIFMRSDVRRGHTIAIVGIGFLGALLCQLFSNAGARVIAISRRRSSLELARAMGAQDTIVMDDHWRIIEEVKLLTGGHLCHRVVEAVGKQWPLDLAAELTAERGKLIIAGYHQDGTRQINLQMWNWRGLDVINAHERDPRIYIEGMVAALDALRRGVLTPDDLYSHSFPLERLADALNMARDRPDGFVKALIQLN